MVFAVKTERKTESMVMGIFSWQMGLALLGAVLFWFSIIRPDSVAMLSDRGDSSSLGLCSVGLLEKISQSPPMKLLHAGKTQEAITAANEALAKQPYDVLTVIVAGNVQCAAGDKNQGINLLRKSTFLCPQSRYVGLNFARYLASTGHTIEAMDKYNDLGKNFPNEWATPRLELATLLLKNRQPEMAVDRLKEVIAADGKNGYARRELGLAMAAQGDAKPGFEEFIKGCGLQSEQGPPPDLEAYIDKIGDRSKAEESLKKEHGDKPEDANITILLSELLLNANRINDARQIIYPPLQSKESSAYKNPESHFILADIANQSGDTEQALMEFRRGAKILMGN